MSRPVHFELLADDPERVAAFYRDALGWEISSWDDQTYWLVTTGEVGTPGIDGGIMHRQFPQPVINTIEVDALDEAIERVRTAGGRLVHGPTEVPDVGMHAYCADPEGTFFGLMEPFAPPPAS